ncbi:hypothetical protein V5N11_002983 [Cardamine amara subsp. amara]|uniref:Uncharacterized protein n=1 Tax=Cardamine amara subsp. amara TaxID=228776 RepID=A0ABD1ABF1_CARAN
MSTDYPGKWRFLTNPDYCSIYRVPNSIRRVNPEAYTPQLVLIGPLNHSLKSLAYKSLGDITNTKSTGYLNMEEYKKIYLEKFKQEVGDLAICMYRRIIEDDEAKIRECYSESTAWIKSPDFVEMILHNCVFVLQFILRTINKAREKTGDPLIDVPCLRITVKRDLILLENQLPYFILNKLFHTRVCRGRSFRELIIIYFGLNGKIDTNSKFSHFTDLYRCAHTETLKELTLGNYEQVDHMQSRP